MFIGGNAEGVHGKRKVGNPWLKKVQYYTVICAS